MGGDDLASDDEYVFGGASDDSDNDSVSSRDDDNNKISTSKKRKVNNNDDDLNSAQVVVGVSSSKKRKKKKHDAPASSKSLLILAGRGIALDGIPSQVKFINTLYAHSIKMSMGASTDDQADNDEASSMYSFTSEDFYSTPLETDEKTKLYQHKNLDAFLKGGPVSMKRLKNWKHPASPMAIIVTLSARRSVELMKGLASLKLPVAKLFAKHFRVEEQVEMLQGQSKGGGGKKKFYSIAVGTPGRLLTLLRHGRDDQGSDNGLGALRLNHTEVIIFDTHEDSKGFNVCTLKDTSSDLMHFMKEGMVPQLQRKKGKMKIALF